MQRKLQLGMTVVAASLLAACGGGDGDTGVSTPVTSTGVFRDAAVSRLYFETSGSSGYTAADGSFTYQVGKTYSFWIGNVKLGSATLSEANATVTPGSLVSSGATRFNTIVNIARFLQTADDDLNTANGIFIKKALDDVGKSTWNQINFAAFNPVGSDELIALSSMTALNSAAPTAYVTFNAARDALADSMNCAYTGAFTGNRMNGSTVDSRVAVVVDGVGQVSALQFFPSGATAYNFLSGTAFDYATLSGTDSSNRVVVQATGPASAWLRYAQTLSQPDLVYVNTNTTSASGFTGSDQAFSRLLGAVTGTRRFEGIVTVPSVTPGYYVFQVETKGTAAAGRVMDLRTGDSAALSGSLSGANLSASGSLNGKTIQVSGTVAVNTWTAVFTDGVPAASTAYKGCQLN